MIPFVSVIIPNYNHAEFLPKRLDTVFNQSFQNFEVIILDDNSSDGSWEYLKCFESHPKVSHCIRNEVNSGSTFSQWKKGLDLAKYEWIWIAESDDYSELNFLESMVSNIDLNISLIYCASFFVDANNDFIESKFPNWEKKDIKYNRWIRDYVNSGQNEIYEFLSFKNTIVNASSVIFRKPIQFPQILVTMKFCGDWYFWIYLLCLGNIYYSSKRLNYFRRHSRSSTVFLDSELEILRVKEIALCIRYARKVLNIWIPNKYDFIYYSNIVKYYAWNFNNLKLPISFLFHFPLFISIQIIYHFFKHVLKKYIFP